MFGFTKVNMGFIGTGYMAGKMAATAGHVPGIRLYAVASRDLERALTFGRDAGFKKAYGSHTELLEDRKVNLVYVATPGYTHYEILKNCIMHGKNVICETPFTLSSEEAREIFEMARQRDLLVMDAVYTRYLPLYRQIKEVLESGVIGEPALLTANIAYDIEHISRLKNREHGGVLPELGIYLLNFAAMFMGDDACRISVTPVYSDEGVDLQDAIVLEYRDGRQSVLTCSMSSNGECRGVIQCTKGYIAIENIKNFESAAVYDMTGTRTMLMKRPKQRSGYEHELKAVLELMKSEVKESEQMPYRQTVSLIHMMEFIRKQIESARPAPVADAADEQTDGFLEQ